MENAGICITMRKDGRYVGKFIAEYADNGKAQYHYVYGKTYEEAENKVLIGREIASRFLSMARSLLKRSPFLVQTLTISAMSRRTSRSRLASMSSAWM